MGTPIFYMGTQENGGTFTDSAGKQEFAGDGEIGMLDWGAVREDQFRDIPFLAALRDELS